MGRETREDILPPDLNLIVRQLMTVDGNVMVDAAARSPPGKWKWSQCEHPATRVHSRHGRQVRALPVGGRGLTVRLRVRRLFRKHGQRRHRTFVEQVAGLAEPRGLASKPRSSSRRNVVRSAGQKGASRTSLGVLLGQVGDSAAWGLVDQARSWSVTW